MIVTPPNRRADPCGLEQRRYVGMSLAKRRIPVANNGLCADLYIRLLLEQSQYPSNIASEIGREAPWLPLGARLLSIDVGPCTLDRTCMATLKTSISSLIVLGALAAVTSMAHGSRSSDSPRAQTNSATVQPVAQPQCGGDTKTETKKPTS